MKFIVCTNCKDIFVPNPVKKRCSCKMTYGFVLNGVTHYGGEFSVPMNFKDEWFTPDSKGRDKDAILVEGDKVISGSERDFSVSVLEYLNHVAGTSYSVKFPSSASNLILARKEEHACSLDDFKRVIDSKWAQWKDTEREKFMRPETLFGKTKFLSYFGEKPYNGSEQTDSKKSGTSRSVKDLLS